MKFVIETPIKAYIKDCSSEEFTELRRKLTYIRTDITFQIGKLKENQWFKRNNPEAYEIRLAELESQKTDILIFKDTDGQYIRPGTIPWLNTSATIENNVKYPEKKEYKWKNKPEFTPYPYQDESVKELIKVKHGNVSLPTGCGKSLITVLLTQKLGLKTVIVTPSKSIFNELYDEFQERFGKNMVGGYGDGKKDIKKPITIAIGKSLTMIKSGSEQEEFFGNKDVVIVDESHTFGSDQLEKVANNVLGNVPYRFFVSATQTRNNGTLKLLESIIGKTVLSMEIGEAIRDGYLCPLKFTILRTFSTNSRTSKDPLITKRQHFLYNNQIAQEIAKLANLVAIHQQKSTLVLVEELQQISILIKLLKVPYTYIHSGSKKDADAWGLEKVKLKDELLKFNKGEVRVLIGTRAISTGTNIHATHLVFNWTGGSSEIVTKQGTMGRSTRRLEISKFAQYHVPKPYSHIFDFYVENQPMLNNQLRKRIGFYKESGGEIVIK